MAHLSLTSMVSQQQLVGQIEIHGKVDDISMHSLVRPVHCQSWYPSIALTHEVLPL